MILDITSFGGLILVGMLVRHVEAAVADFRNSYPGLSTRETLITLVTWW